MEFRKIRIEDRELIDEYWSRTDINGCTYSFAYLMSWKYFRFNEMEIAEEDNVIYIRFPVKSEWVYLSPLTVREKYADAVKKIFSSDPAATIVQVERSYVDLLNPDEYVLEHNPSYDEYLYSADSLITLQGKKYHAKRNHVKKFYEKYPDYIYRNYSEEDKNGVLELFDDWKQEKGIEPTDEEYALRFMLDNYNLLRLKASVVVINGDIVGFTMGEISPSNIGIVHIEKGNINYEGIYPAINRMFATENFASVRYINRQEDMGIEGLRKAKRSYYPVDMCERWTIRLKNN